MTHSSAEQTRTGRAVAMAAVAAPALGLLAASVLSLGHLLDLPVPCGGRSGCAIVAEHAASRLGGVPIAYFGFAAYVVLLALLARPLISRRVLTAATLISGVGTAVSAVLLFIAWRVIHATCGWCVLSACAMASTFVVTLWRRCSAGAGSPGAPKVFVWAALFAAAIAVGVQAGWMFRGGTRAPVAPEILARVGPGELFASAPSLGPVADPAVTVVVFADFFCPACRRAMNSLLHYQRGHPEDVRLVFRHRPLWQLPGHETSRAAAALSEMAAERDRFWEFLLAMHTLDRAPEEARYLAIMQSLGLDPVTVARRLETPDDPAVQRVLADEVLADRLGIHATPTFIVLVQGRPPVSATARTLPRELNSPAVIELLTRRAGARRR